MRGSTLLETHDDGTVVVVKSGGPERNVEADILCRVVGPAVVEVLDVIVDGDDVQLHLGFVTGTALTHHPALGLPDLLRVLAGVAGALTHVHQRDVTHGALEPDHVLVDDQCRVVLCGFGDAAVSGDHTVDRIAFGDLIASELERSVDAGSVGRRDPATLALGAVADDLRAADGHGMAIDDALGRLERLAANAQATTGSGRGRRAAAISVAVVAAAGVGWVVGLPGGTSRVDAARVAATPAVASAAEPARRADTAAPVPGATPTLLAASAPSCPSTRHEHGDACPDVPVVDGADVTRGRARYEVTVSAPGPTFTVVGDWDCNGTTTMAVVAVSGEVFVFDRWADDGPISVTPTDDVSDTVGDVHAATRARTEDGCDAIAVVGAAGRVVVQLETP